MKPISINIQGDFIDGYLYLGRLFLVKDDGYVVSILMDDVLVNFEEETYFKVLVMAFLRNDWLSNSQSNVLLGIKGMLDRFNLEWKRAASLDLNLSLNQIKFKQHFPIPDAPIFDIKAYGMRLYLGNRNGLYESVIDSDRDSFKNIYQPKIIFDSRTTYISAKSGELILSSNSDGLFTGRIGIGVDKSKINHRPEASRSVRTGWSNYDVVNYETQNSFVYFKNELEEKDKRKLEKRVPYSAYDEHSENKKIKNFGVEKLTQDSLMPIALKDRHIKYSFNSSSYCFFVTDDNKLYSSSFIKDGAHDLHLSKYLQSDDLREITTIRGGKIMSAYAIYKGSIIETVSSVIMTRKNEKPIVLYDQPVFSVKTFLASKRFKNIVLIFHEDGVLIHSLYPADLLTK